MEQDPYFQCLSLDPLHVQTLGHLLQTRDHSDLGGTAEDVEKQFDQHDQALQKMSALCAALKSTATEWRATSKALAKAKALERKAFNAEKKRLQKQQEAAEKKKKKAAAAMEQAAQEKQQHDADDGVESAKGQDKKRRIASKLMSELTESDPPILLARYPSCQIPVVEELDTWMAY